jgi:hypothetical protein
MRFLLLLVLLLPMVASAQINRSAREYAMDNIQEYMSTKVLKGKMYKPLAYGQLKPCIKVEKDAIWMIEHKFETQQTESVDKKKTTIQRQGKFYFYLDDKMKVVRAESSELY